MFVLIAYRDWHIQFVQTSDPFCVVHTHHLYSASTPMAEKTHMYYKSTVEMKLLSLPRKEACPNEAKEVVLLHLTHSLPQTCGSSSFILVPFFPSFNIFLRGSFPCLFCYIKFCIFPKIMIIWMIIIILSFRFLRTQKMPEWWVLVLSFFLFCLLLFFKQLLKYKGDMNWLLL